MNTMLNIWHAYQAKTTFDWSRFISVYERGVDRGFGFRDSMQGVLGVMHSIPELAGEHIKLLLSIQCRNGNARSVYYPATKESVGGGRSDDHLWSPFSVCNYVKETGNGNWGFLYDEATDTQTLAPVFDCGSSMFPQADEQIMESILSDKRELNYRIYENPTSALQINGKRIKYYDYIVSLENEDCNAALKRIMPRIDLHAMCNMIDEISCISDLQKRFYKTLLCERKEKILDYAYTLLLEKESTEQKPSVRG